MTNSLRGIFDSHIVRKSKSLAGISSKFWSAIIILLIISVALENFKLFDLAGAPFKVTHIVFAIGIVYGFFTTKIKPKQFVLFLLFIALPLLPLYRINDKLEWFKSYAIYLLIVLFTFFCFKQIVKEFTRKKWFFTKWFLLITSICEILGIVQFITVNFLGIDFLNGIFGSFEFHPTMTSISNGFTRSYSLFHEPSVLGWVTISSLVVVLLSRHCFKKTRTFWLLFALNLLSVFASMSFLALAEAIIILLVYQFIKTKNKTIILLSVVGFLIAFLILYFFTPIFSGISRISEINRESSSGYERLISPINYVISTFRHYPLFGRGLGQEGDVDLVGTIGIYEGINNSIFGLLANFGLSALVIVFFVFAVFGRCLKQNKAWVLIIFCLFAIYVSTGAYISLDTFIFVVLLFSFGKAFCLKKQLFVKRKGKYLC